MRNLVAIFACITAIVCVSCGKDKEQEQTIAVTSVAVSPESVELVVEQTFQLSATVLPDDASDKAVSWTSSKQSLATVSDNGLVTAIAEGVVTITARAGGKSGTCTISICKNVIAVTSIELSKTSTELVEGESETLTATVKPDDATDKTVNWLSSNPSIAAVTDGKVLAITPGTATITAKAGDKSASCNVTVKQKVIEVESVVLSTNRLEITEGESETLTATVKPDDATDKNVVWSSADNSIATVDKGKVFAISYGETIVYASCGGKVAECSVVVVKKVIHVSSISLSKNQALIFVGDSPLEMIATVLPDEATDKSIEWISTDESVVTVVDGLVTAVSQGEADIYAKALDGSGITSSKCHIQTIKEPEGAVFLGTYTSEGNPLFWATCNLGASSPEDYGDYFAWGEKEPKQQYLTGNYAYGNGEKGPFSKYNTLEKFGEVDNLTKLELEDDAAHVILGGKWRMPSKAEINDLRANCKWEWTSQGGVPGCRVTGKAEGVENRSIFLPYAGYKTSEVHNAGTYGQGHYWSSSLHSNAPDFSWDLYITQGVKDSNFHARWQGQSIRPVTE